MKLRKRFKTSIIGLMLCNGAITSFADFNGNHFLVSVLRNFILCLSVLTNFTSERNLSTYSRS